MLDMADDLASDEAMLFAMVHPDDPQADEARICAEALDRGIVALVALAGSHGGQRPEAA